MVAPGPSRARTRSLALVPSCGTTTPPPAPPGSWPSPSLRSQTVTAHKWLKLRAAVLGWPCFPTSRAQSGQPGLLATTSPRCDTAPVPP
eukprot:2434147-Pyramimonas_sp.AAC.1